MYILIYIYIYIHIHTHVCIISKGTAWPRSTWMFFLLFVLLVALWAGAEANSPTQSLRGPNPLTPPFKSARGGNAWWRFGGASSGAMKASKTYVRFHSLGVDSGFRASALGVTVLGSLRSQVW